MTRIHGEVNQTTQRWFIHLTEGGTNSGQLFPDRDDSVLCIVRAVVTVTVGTLTVVTGTVVIGTVVIRTVVFREGRVVGTRGLWPATFPGEMPVVREEGVAGGLDGHIVCHGRTARRRKGG